MDEEQQKPVSMAPMKNRTNDRKAFCLLYLSLMASASIAVAVQAMDEKKDELTAVVHDMLLGMLYATSTFVMFGATLYFALKRRETFELAHRSSGPITFTVKYSRLGEPVNLYLRLGLAMFAAMSIGQSSIKLQEISADPNSRHWFEIFKCAFELTFIISQTLFILVYHRIVILQSNEIFGACFIHVMSTNLCMWADVIVDKVRTTLHLGIAHDYSHHQYDASYLNSSEYTVVSGETKSVSFYLLPAVSEYCLLSAALIYDIIVRIGEPSFIELEEEDNEDDTDDDEEGATTEETTYRSQSTASDKKKNSHRIPRNAGGQRSLLAVLAHYTNKTKSGLEICSAKIRSGYWAPLCIVLVISALTITTGVAPKRVKVTAWKCGVLFAEEMCLNCMGIFVTLVAFFKIRTLKFTIASRQSLIDEFVLYIAFFFSANYLVATVALASYFNRTSSVPTYQDLLMGRLILTILELIEVILQTYLIQDCFRRCSEEEPQQRMKPGRQMIAVLLGINLAGWVVKSFQMKEADVLYNITTDNGDIPYGWVLVAITMPVYLFYRYHCTVCLSQAFNMLYEDETSRFEALWRQNPIYLSNLLSNTNIATGEDDRAAGVTWDSDATPMPKLSNRQLYEMFHRRMSSQSIQQLDFMMPRRASFFHTGGIPSTASVAELDPTQTGGGASYHPMHKFSVGWNQKKLSIPSSSSAKRLSMPTGAVETNHEQTSPNPPPLKTSKMRLAESESYEGPNYFLSRVGPTVRSEHSTQATVLPYDQRQPGLAYTNSHQYHTKVGHLQQPRARMMPPTAAVEMEKKLTRRPPTTTGENNDDQKGTDQMKRRQTLVNLETAKYRYLAAEMAHKRVLERSGDAESKSRRKTAACSDGKKTASSSKKKHPNSKNPAPPDLSKNGNAPTVNGDFVNLSALGKSSHHLPPALPHTEYPTTHQAPARGFEPSKVVPLLIARNLVSQSDGGLLSAVPEEEGQEKSDLNKFWSSGTLEINDDYYTERGGEMVESPKAPSGTTPDMFESIVDEEPPYSKQNVSNTNIAGGNEAYQDATSNDSEKG